MAAGVEEIDRTEDGVVGDAKHLNAVGLQAPLDRQQLVERPDFEGDVLGPGRRVAVTVHRRSGRQLEESEDVAAAGIEEDVHVGVSLAGRRHLVLGDGEDEIHAQVPAIPLDGLVGVDAAVGHMVNFPDTHCSPLGVGLPLIARGRQRPQASGRHLRHATFNRSRARMAMIAPTILVRADVAASDRQCDVRRPVGNARRLPTACINFGIL